MAQIFEALKGIVVRALPTFFLVILFHWYLKKVLIQPLERVLAERRKRTEGAVEASEASLEQASQKMAAYEKALYEARAAIYDEQEKNRQRLTSEQAAALDAARKRSTVQVAEARAAIAADVEAARASLAADSDRLAEQIAGAVFAGRN